jgi:glucose/arabinose dehydrogenase
MRKRPIQTFWIALILLAATSVMTTLAVRDATPAAAQVAGGFDFTRPQVVASGLTVPWGMAFLPDGTPLVSERNSGRVLRLQQGGQPVQVATITGVSASGESGLLGLAVSPTYAQDGFIYAYFTANTGGGTDNRIVRFTLAQPQNQQVILSGLQAATIHDGGRIAFGPDGMLYAGVGDAGNTGNAQNMQSRNGKILRMRPDGGVPTGNPFANSLVYSLGHRNVQGLAWDAQGRLYATEFGQNSFDEVNQIVAGGNYGWPTVEGMGSNPNFRNPIVVWTTAEASPSGAAIANNFLFAAALRGTRLWAVPLNGNGGAGTPVAELQGQFGRLRTVMRGPDGWLWVATSNRDGRGQPAASDDRVIRFPPVSTPSSPGTSSSSRPPSSSSRPPSSSSSPQQPGACAVRWVVDQWGTGFVARVTITNGGPSLNGWTLNWTFPGNQRVTGFWESIITQAAGSAAVSARNESYNGNLPTGGSVSFGFQATYSGANTRPSDFRLGTTPCTVS